MEVVVHDVVEEILEKLPPKSLVRFKSVSKQWKSTIESRVFQHKHLTHHRQKSKTPHLLTISMNHKVAFPALKSMITLELESSISNNIPIPWENKLFKFCQNSIDGLVCLYDNYGSTIIFNPATRWYRTLPPSIYQQSQSMGQFGSLGFGKDQINGLYKPVWLYSSWELNSDNKAIICEVFDFDNNAWRLVKPSSPPHKVACWYELIYLNGLFYWLTAEDEEEIPSVLSLDLHTETCEIVCRAPFSDMDLYNLNDNLCCSEYFEESQAIWSWNLEEKTWNKMYSIDTVRICRFFEKGWCHVTPLVFVEEKKKELMLCDHYYCHRETEKQLVVLYDSQTTSYHVVAKRQNAKTFYYFPSLISIL